MKTLEITWNKPMDMQCKFPCEGGMHLLVAGFASIGYLHGKVGLRELLFESDVSAVGSVKQNLSGKECEKALCALSCVCYHSLPLSLHAVGWSTVGDCGISWSHRLTF